MRKALWLVTLARQVAAEPGTTFPGRVTGVTAKGVFVTLDGSRVSGMVAARDLPGRGWSETPDGLALVDGAGHRLGYGDAVVVQVLHADVEAGQLELRLQAPARRRRAGGAAQARRRRRGPGRAAGGGRCGGGGRSARGAAGAAAAAVGAAEPA